MVKGGTSLDMRGRCSAGQKVCIFFSTWISRYLELSRN